VYLPDSDPADEVSVPGDAGEDPRVPWYEGPPPPFDVPVDQVTAYSDNVREDLDLNEVRQATSSEFRDILAASRRDLDPDHGRSAATLADRRSRAYQRRRWLTDCCSNLGHRVSPGQASAGTTPAKLSPPPAPRQLPAETPP
jgi:hypothetical protein